MAGPTLTQIRQRIAQLAGPSLFSTSSASSTASVLIDTTWPAASAGAAPTLWKDAWLFIPGAASAADKVRIVNTYTASATEGDFAFDAPLSAASVGQSVAYELHTIFEPKTAMTRIINQALKECYIPVEFSFNPTNNTNTRHSLAVAAPWLNDPVQIRRVGYLASGASRSVTDPYQYGAGIRGRPYADGTVVYLDIGAYQTTDTIYVRALKRAYDHCAAAATPTVFTQAGLSAEGDVVADLVALEWIAAAGLYQGWLEYSAMLEANDRVRISQATAAAMVDQEDPHYAAREPHTATQIRRWGPSPNGFGLGGWAMWRAG